MPAPLSRYSTFPNTVAIVVFTLLGGVFFGPTLFKSMLSDDFQVMQRIIYNRQFYTPDFFRPLSDLSLYGCYLLAGLKPFLYNFFNFCLHIGSTFLLYRFCLSSDLFKVHQRHFIAWWSALLFLIYPFHNEPIVWIVGRASMMACILSFGALLCLVSVQLKKWQIGCACLLYFIALTSYETIMPLPAIALVILYRPGVQLKTYRSLVFGFGITLVLHFVLRIGLSRMVIGGYGSKVLQPSAGGYAVNFLKIMGRSFLPPSNNSTVLALFSVALFAALGFFVVRQMKTNSNRLPFYKLILCWLLANLVPVLFGVSTHTFEGDRMLYFSSFFLMILFAYSLSLVKKITIRSVAIAAIAIYFSWFLIQNNKGWIRAGDITDDFINMMRVEKKPGQTLAIINLPQETNGAFIFRNGFRNALFLNGIDTVGITVLTTITTEAQRQFGEMLQPQSQPGATFIPPFTYLQTDSIWVIQPLTAPAVSYNSKAFTTVFFWNGRALIKLK